MKQNDAALINVKLKVEMLILKSKWSNENWLQILGQTQHIIVVPRFFPYVFSVKSYQNNIADSRFLAQSA